MHWTIRVDDVPAGAREATLWIAVPQELPEQSVSGLAVETDAPWRYVEDPDFHNRVVRVTVPDPASTLSVGLSARVVRRPVLAPEPAALDADPTPALPAGGGAGEPQPEDPRAGRQHRGHRPHAVRLRRVDMTYDKQTPGWGHGDSERACDVRKGNCTDFHSLFLSLSRAEGVPARFEMGYPMSLAGETDRTGGYHCWAWFYDDGARAWVPVDISEANLEPERSDFLFGHLDAERVAFSRGRDVKLPGMQGRPLNYLPIRRLRGGGREAARRGHAQPQLHGRRGGEGGGLSGGGWGRPGSFRAGRDGRGGGSRGGGGGPPAVTAKPW